MKALAVKKQLLIAIVILAMAQFACNMGANATPAPVVPTAGNENTTVAPTEAAQAIPTSTKSERGTPDEAKAMLQQAVEHYTSVGRDQALKDFNTKVPPFFDRDLYVVCFAPDHSELANGGFPQYVGSSADGLQDNNGTPLGKAIWDLAASNAVNSVDYHWVNPVSGQTEPKTLFFQKVDSNTVCGVGVYNPK
jgi:hypothetical protein